MSRKQFFVFKLIALLFLMIEIANLVFTVVYDPFPYWREYGSSVFYIILFASMIFMLSRITPTDLAEHSKKRWLIPLESNHRKSLKTK